MEQKLETAAKTENTSKSDIIKEALEQYFSREEEKNSWELGEPYFGRYGSGDGSLSSDYKNRLKGKIGAKYHTD
jgi:predicted DNA-binding protein